MPLASGFWTCPVFKSQSLEENHQKAQSLEENHQKPCQTLNIVTIKELFRVKTPAELFTQINIK